MGAGASSQGRGSGQEGKLDRGFGPLYLAYTPSGLNQPSLRGAGLHPPA